MGRKSNGSPRSSLPFFSLGQTLMENTRRSQDSPTGSPAKSPTEPAAIPIATTGSSRQRVEWVDYAKGCCIILVVMLHAVGSYEWKIGTEGWMRPMVEFARPFRMPDFFLISGLFLHRGIRRPAREYFDRKVLHFVYFYILWLIIQYTAHNPGLLASAPSEFFFGWFTALFEPINTLWFIHMLAIFHLVAWFARKLPYWSMLAIGAGLQSLYQLGALETGFRVADRFFSYFVYFLIGYIAAPFIFRIAHYLQARTSWVLVLLAVWGLVNWQMVGAELHEKPVTSLIMGLSGAAAICAISLLVARLRFFSPLRYVGQNSIVVYLTFVLPLNASEILFVRYGDLFGSVGWSTFAITVIAVVTPLLFARAIANTPLIALYRRPAAFKIPGTCTSTSPSLKPAVPGSGLV